MKKLLAILCATMLCVCCLALAACGGGSTSAASASAAASGDSASASAAQNAKPANPADKFVGKWALVGAQSGGIILTGDFQAVLGDDLDISLTVNADNTASISYNGESLDCTWTLKNDNVITLTAKNPQEGGEKLVGGEPVDVEYNSGNNTLVISSIEEDMTAILLFSQTGAIEGILDITTSNATPVTDKNSLVGTWRICGMNMQGVMMYGDADELAQYMGATDMSLTLNADGTGSIIGENISWTVDSKGAMTTIEGIDCPIYQFGENEILLDLTPGMGSTMIFVYTK